MASESVDQAFREFQESGDPDALARVYDATAPGLLRSAVHLSGNLAVAEDLVQATFVAAIEGADSYDPGRPVRPWLAGILGRQAKLRARRDGRQPSADRWRGPIEGALDDDATSVADAVATADQRRRLQEAVDGLAEPYRTVVVLQLRHGLSPTEIGHALGRSSGTVRSQLARGIELLRRAVADVPSASMQAVLGAIVLPRGLDVVRAEVLGVAKAAVGATVGGAAAGAAGVHAASAAGASTASLVFGGIVMKKIAAFGAAALVVAASVFLWTDGDGVAIDDPNGPGGDRTVALPEVDVATSTSAPPAGEPAAPRPDRVATPVEPAATDAEPEEADVRGSVRVKVVAADGGAALADVPVWLQSNLEFTGWVPRVIERSNDIGEAVFADIDSGPWSVQSQPGVTGSAFVTPGEEAVVELRIPRGVDVRGRVVDGDGLPIPGATLWLSDPWRSMRGEDAGVSDGDGAFVIRHLTADRYVAARAPGYEPSRTYPIDRHGGDVSGLRIVLRRGGAVVVGRVLDTATRAPVANARILLGDDRPRFTHRNGDGSWVPGPPPREVRADADGRFRAEHVPHVADGLVVQVLADGFAPYRGVIVTTPAADGAPAEQDLLLLAGGSVAGKVRDEDGGGIVGALVQVGAHAAFATRTVMTGFGGVYRVDDLATGTATASVRFRSMALTGQELELTAPGSTVEWNPTLRDEDAASKVAIRGQVIAANGEPQARWTVAARADSTTEPVGRRTDADGRFVLPINASWERAHVYAHAPRKWSEFPSVVMSDVDPHGGEIVLVVPDPALAFASYRGRVLTPDGRPAAAKLQVWLEGPATMWRQFPTDPETGEFAIDRVPPGRVHVSVRSDKYPWIDLEPRDVTAGERIELGDLAFRMAGRIVGSLRRADGQPLPSDLRGYVVDGRGASAGVLTVAGDRFESGALADGDYRIFFQGTGVGPVDVDLTLAGSGIVDRSIALPAGFGREVRIEMPDGAAPPPRFGVYIWRRGGRIKVIWRRNLGPGDGLTCTAYLEPGEYSVRVVSGARWMGITEFTVSRDAGGAKPVVVPLTPRD